MYFICFIVCQEKDLFLLLSQEPAFTGLFVWKDFISRGSSFWLQLSFSDFAPLPIDFLLPPPAAPGSLMMSYDVFCMKIDTFITTFLLEPWEVLILLMCIRFLLLTFDMAYQKINFIAWYMCSPRKYPYSPHKRDWDFLGVGWRGSVRPKI